MSLQLISGDIFWINFVESTSIVDCYLLKLEKTICKWYIYIYIQHDFWYRIEGKENQRSKKIPAWMGQRWYFSVTFLVEKLHIYLNFVGINNNFIDFVHILEISEASIKKFQWSKIILKIGWRGDFFLLTIFCCCSTICKSKIQRNYLSCHL